MLLHIMVKYNPCNRIEKKLIVFYVYHGGLKYVNIKNHNYVLKNTKILLIFFFMKFVISTSHVIPHTLNHVKSLLKIFKKERE
jgi:hypothetical protein